MDAEAEKSQGTPPGERPTGSQIALRGRELAVDVDSLLTGELEPLEFAKELDTQFELMLDINKALAAEYLLRALDDPSEAVRATAATYLGWLREKRAIPGLETLLGDASQQVANAALHAAALIRG